MNESLRVDLRASTTLTFAVGAGHLLALGAAAIGLPPVAAAVTVAGLGISLVQCLRLATHRSAEAVVGLEFWSDGRLAVAGPSGEWLPARLRYAAVPAGWLALVIARDQAGRARHAVVLRDGADPDAFRRLRVWLKWRVLAHHGGARDTLDHAAR